MDGMAWHALIFPWSGVKLAESALGWLGAVATAELIRVKRVKGARHESLGSSCLIMASTT